MYHWCLDLQTLWQITWIQCATRSTESMQTIYLHFQAVCKLTFCLTFLVSFSFFVNHRDIFSVLPMLCIIFNHCWYVFKVLCHLETSLTGQLRVFNIDIPLLNFSFRIICKLEVSLYKSCRSLTFRILV